MSSNIDNEHYAFQSQTLLNVDLKSIEAEFERLSKFYKFFFKEFMPKDKTSSIIDLPCGHGNILHFLKKEGFTNCKGYDIDKGRVEISRSLGFNAELSNALLQIKEFDNNLQVIFSLDFLEHIDKADALNYIQDCYKALKPGGRLIVRTPVTDSIRGGLDLFNDFTHKWAVNSSVLIAIFKQAGFKNVILKDERPQPYKFINLIRLIVFNVFKTITNFYYLCLGFSRIKVWSTSCFIIATKG